MVFFCWVPIHTTPRVNNTSQRQKPWGDPVQVGFSLALHFCCFPSLSKGKQKNTNKTNGLSQLRPVHNLFLHEMGDAPLSLLFSLSTTYVSLPTSHCSHANSQACLSLSWSMRNVTMARHPYPSDNCSLITRAVVPVVMLTSALLSRRMGKVLSCQLFPHFCLLISNRIAIHLLHSHAFHSLPPQQTRLICMPKYSLQEKNDVRMGKRSGYLHGVYVSIYAICGSSRSCGSDNRWLSLFPMVHGIFR